VFSLKKEVGLSDDDTEQSFLQVAKPENPQTKHWPIGFLGSTESKNIFRVLVEKLRFPELISISTHVMKPKF
jgi:hypothetical protein